MKLTILIIILIIILIAAMILNLYLLDDPSKIIYVMGGELDVKKPINQLTHELLPHMPP